MFSKRLEDLPLLFPSMLFSWHCVMLFTFGVVSCVRVLNANVLSSNDENSIGIFPVTTL